MGHPESIPSAHVDKLLLPARVILPGLEQLVGSFALLPASPFRDGPESLLELVVSEPTDLIVLELGSAELPAVEACLRLRADRRTARIPVLVLASEAADAEALTQSGCNEVIPAGIEPRILQEKIAGALGLRLRRHPRFPVVLPVARGRIFHEFLGYSNSLSEAGMGFDTLARIRSGDELNLKIYRFGFFAFFTIYLNKSKIRPEIEGRIF